MDMASWILGDEKEPRGAVGEENEVEGNEEDALNGDEKFLTDSGITSPTEQGSVTSEEDLFTPSTWLGGLGADFKNLASSLKETAGGVVGFVHRSAMSVAAEIAELEEGYSGGSKEDADERVLPLPLPWEVMVADPDGTGELYREDGGLKRKILLLSSDDKTFVAPFSSSAAHADQGDELFVLDEARIQLIRHLLEVDENLALSHARLSGRSHTSEVTFWRNYLHHCDQAKVQHEAEAIDVANEREVDRVPIKQEGEKISRTKSDDESSYVCVNADVISPPTSLNWSGMIASSDGDLVVLGNLKPAANVD